jgi:hypothetical protein
MKRLLIALTATALTVGGAAIASPAFAETPAPTVSATASATPTATATPSPTAAPAGIAVTNAPTGSASNLTAVLTGVPAGSAVTLQRAKGSSTNWVDLTTRVSDTTGKVSFSGVHSNHSQLFRVVSGTTASNVIAVKQYALSPVTLTLKATRSGDYVRTTGTASYTSVWLDNGAQFTDTIKGHRVHLQRYTTKWKDADIIHSSATGSLTDKVKYETKSMFRFASVATSTYQVAASISEIK